MGVLVVIVVVVAAAMRSVLKILSQNFSKVSTAAACSASSTFVTISLRSASS